MRGNPKAFFFFLDQVFWITFNSGSSSPCFYCPHLVSRSTVMVVIPEHLVISGSHPNQSMSLDAGTFLILPEVVCRFSDRNSFFLQMAIKWFVSWNVVGLWLGHHAPRNGSHVCTRTDMATTSHHSLLVKIDCSSPRTLLRPGFIHVCEDVCIEIHEICLSIKLQANFAHPSHFTFCPPTLLLTM